MTPEQQAAIREAVARAIEETMFAEHELPIEGELHERYLETTDAAIAAHLKALEAAGIVLVPTEPTDEMRKLAVGIIA